MFDRKFKMRLNYLALCLCALAVSACSSVPVQTNGTSNPTSSQQVAQRATQALNSVYEQPSFNFKGRVDADVEFKNKNANQQPATISAEQKNVLENYLRLNSVVLSEQDKQQLFNLVTATEKKKSIFSNSRNNAIAYIFGIFANHGELGYQGGLDYRKKLFNLELSYKYHTANTYTEQRLPILVDFNQSRAYLNHFNPESLTGKAKKYYQAYYLDFSEHKDTTLKSVDWKNILEFLKANNGHYYHALIGDERIEVLTPTEAERKQGAVEKIRLHTSVEALILKEVIFDIVNKQYTENLIDFDKVKKAFTDSVQNKNKKPEQKQMDSASEQASEVRNLIFEHYDNLQYGKAEQESDDKDSAPVEAEKDKAVIAEPAKPSEKSKADDDNITPELTEEQCRALIAKKEAFGRLTECRYEYGVSIYQNKVEDKSTDALTSAYGIFKLLTLSKDEDSDFYQTFNAYNKGQLTSGKALADIMQRHKDIIDPILKEESYPLTFDVTLDNKGRLIHNNSVIQLDTQFDEIKIKGAINYHSHISNYGQAKIDTYDLANRAKSIKEHPLLVEVMNEENQRYDDNVETLAKKLIEQNYQQHKSYEKAYIIGFITLFSNAYPEMLSSVSAQDLQEIAKVYAYSYADETLYKLSIADIKAVQALEKKHQLNSQEQMFNGLGQDVASLVEDVIKEHVMSSEDMALLKKYKTPEALFSQIYQQEFGKEEYDYEQLSHEDKKHLAETADILAKAYVAKKNGSLNLETIKGLQAEHEGFFYSMTYMETVLKTERLLKFAKK